jgi:hypothetical protein
MWVGTGGLLLLIRCSSLSVRFIQHGFRIVSFSETIQTRVFGKGLEVG